MSPSLQRQPCLLQLFNRYRERGGEEQSAERIFHQAQRDYRMERLWWDSRDWDKKDAPSKFGQVRRLFYNPDSAREISQLVLAHRVDALLCHNIYPIGGPSLYHTALKLNIPVIQYLHNFRPFSVGGPLWARDHVAVDSMRLKHRQEVLAGAWQNSIVKSALFSLVLRRLHASGWLDSVKCWIAISDFIRGKFIEAGIPAERVHTLRHCWEPQGGNPDLTDNGYYLFLARLIPEKGVAVALDAWRILEQHLGPNCPKLIVCGTGSQEEKVQAADASSEKIEFLGFVEGSEKIRLIEQCRAMIAPSVCWEALGLVTYEAYDYRKPMLAAASGGLTETVQDGTTGFLHEPGNAGDLAKSVTKLEAMESDSRCAMGEAGYRWLLSEASRNRWQGRFREIVDGTLDRHRE